MHMLMLPGNFSRPGDFSLSYWIPEYDDIDTVVDQYFGYGTQQASRSSDPAYITVAIQDSTDNQAAVESLKDTLRDSGYSNIYVDQDWNEPLPITRIVAQQGDIDTAEMIHRFLGVGEVRVESTGVLNSDITIQLGQDWLQTRSTQL
jgi:hypothetical protein